MTVAAEVELGPVTDAGTQTYVVECKACETRWGGLTKTDAWNVKRGHDAAAARHKRAPHPAKATPVQAADAGPATDLPKPRGIVTELEKQARAETEEYPFPETEADLQDLLVDAYRAGWIARATEPGMVLVTREYLALLEERARLWVRAGGR